MNGQKRTIIRNETPRLRSADNDGTRTINSFAVVPQATTNFGDIEVDVDGKVSLVRGITKGYDFTHFTSAASDFNQSSSGADAFTSQGWPYINSSSNWMGVMRAGTGSTSTGMSCWNTGSDLLAPGYGKAFSLEGLLSMEVLSSVSEEYQLWYGFANNLTNSSTPTSGVYFSYDRDGRSGDSVTHNWYAVTINGGVETATDTGVVAVPGVTQAGKRMKIVIALDGLSADFYIDGVSVATHTTNMPTGRMGYGGKILKSAGTTSVTAGWDWNIFSWSGSDDLS
jgi:hypothetical protein